MRQQASPGKYLRMNAGAGLILAVSVFSGTAVEASMTQAAFPAGQTVAAGGILSANGTIVDRLKSFMNASEWTITKPFRISRKKTMQTESALPRNKGVKPLREVLNRIQAERVFASSV